MDGIYAKGMEAHGAALLTKKVPQFGICINVICMDNDSSTKVQLQEDVGPEYSGCMDSELTVTNFYEDPSYKKKICNNGL